MEWQPIETAPKDGTVILLYRPNTVRWHQVAEGEWDRRSHEKNPSPYWRCWWSIAYKNMDKEFPPTHWMPLPEPPK